MPDVHTYRIDISGCDDSTEFEWSGTPEQAAVVRKIAEKSVETSEYGCQPTMRITGGPNAD